MELDVGIGDFEYCCGRLMGASELLISECDF